MKIKIKTDQINFEFDDNGALFNKVAFICDNKAILSFLTELITKVSDESIKIQTNPIRP